MATQIYWTSPRRLSKLGIFLGAGDGKGGKKIDKLENISNFFGGRITLIKAILSNIPVYFIYFPKIPVKVARMIEQLQRNFLWEGYGGKKDHLIRWEEVCLPKEAGGLGIGNIVPKKKNSLKMVMEICVTR